MNIFKQKIWIYIKNYRFHSIFLKNLGIIIILVLIPLVCGLGSLYYVYNRVQESEERAYADEKFSMVYENFSGLFEGLREKAMVLSLDKDVELFLYSDDIEKDTHYNLKNIQNFMSLYKISSDVIENIYIFAPSSQVVITTSGRIRCDDFYDRKYIDMWEDDGESFQYEYVVDVNSKICLYYTVQYSPQCRGVIILLVNVEKLKREYSYDKEMRIAILGENGVLYDSNREWDGALMDAADIKAASEGNILRSDMFEGNQLELFLSIDKQTLYDTLHSMKKIIVLIGSVMVVTTMILAIYFSGKIFDPITEILDVLEHTTGVDKGMLSQNSDEVSYIKDSIYTVISRKKDVEEELLERIQLLKRAQAIALQAQINPHFINNTLETVNWMAIRKLGKENDISKMLKCLLQILRILWETPDTFTTLSEEIEYVEKYIFIQQKRLGDNFDVIFDVPKRLEECKVIRMILQPIVENAIIHGIKPYSGRGVIRISVSDEKDILKISVKDSGMGITQEEVKNINNSLGEKKIRESSHIGLSNVNQRIRLMFGDDYGVTFKSTIDEGTEVILSLPIR